MDEDILVCVNHGQRDCSDCKNNDAYNAQVKEIEALQVELDWARADNKELKAALRARDEALEVAERALDDCIQVAFDGPRETKQIAPADLGVEDYWSWKRRIEREAKDALAQVAALRSGDKPLRGK